MILFKRKIIKEIFIVVFFLFCSRAIYSQNRSDNKDFIEFTFPSSVDSLLIQKLDSIKKDLIDDNFVIDIYFYREKLEDYSPYGSDYRKYGYNIRLILIEKHQKPSSYIYYLAKNSNRYYVSSNKEYKIPIVYIMADELFKYDHEVYKHKITILKVLYALSYANDFYPTKIDINYPILDFLLKEELK